MHTFSCSDSAKCFSTGKHAQFFTLLAKAWPQSICIIQASTHVCTQAVNAKAFFFSFIVLKLIRSHSYLQSFTFSYIYVSTESGYIQINGSSTPYLIHRRILFLVLRASNACVSIKNVNITSVRTSCLLTLAYDERQQHCSQRQHNCCLHYFPFSKLLRLMICS